MFFVYRIHDCSDRKSLKSQVSSLKSQAKPLNHLLICSLVHCVLIMKGSLLRELNAPMTNVPKLFGIRQLGLDI